MSTCRICGCDDMHACKGGCFWVEPNLCSQCQMKLHSYQVSVLKGYYIGKNEITVALDALVIADELPTEDEAVAFIHGYVEAKNEYDNNETLEFIENPQPSEYYTVFQVQNIETKSVLFFQEVE